MSMDDEDLLPEGGLGEGAQVVDANEPENDQPISVDDLATEMGWTPQEKWRGDPEKWKPAADFLKATVDVNKGLGGQLREMRSQIDNMARTSAVLTQRALDEQREKILAERSEAIDMGDHAAVNLADQKLQTLNVTIPKPVDPEVRAFTERNTWFEKDEEATAWAINRAGELARQGIGTARQLATVEREAKQLFPDLFPEQIKPKPAPLSKPGNRGATPQGNKSFSSLPAGAQAAALDYERRSGGRISREDYAKTYYEELG